METSTSYGKLRNTVEDWKVPNNISYSIFLLLVRNQYRYRFLGSISYYEIVDVEYVYYRWMNSYKKKCTKENLNERKISLMIAISVFMNFKKR